MTTQKGSANIIITIVALLIVVAGAVLLFSGDGGQDTSSGSDSPAGPGGHSAGAGTPGGDTLPDFAFENLEGGTVTHADFEGKALVVNSWAVWCPFCRNELPDFAKLQEEFKDEIAVIAIDRAESKEKQLEFLNEIDVRDGLVFLLDPNDTFYRQIGGFSMPETLFVDKERNIVTHKRGFMRLDEMRELTRELLQSP